MNDRPTPETDAQIVTMECEDSCCAIYSKLNGSEFEGDVVPYDFARNLERERDELRERHGCENRMRLEMKAQRDGLLAEVERLLRKTQTDNMTINQFRELIETLKVKGIEV